MNKQSKEVKFCVMDNKYILLDVLLCSIADYYMASSVRGQDEPNRTL